MTGTKQYVTKEGLKKLEDELQQLKTEKRKEIASRIAEAKELGDLSENAEYHEAKEEQGFVEARIGELEVILKNTEIINHRKNTKVVQIGSTVKIKMKGGAAMEVTIVGSSEANPSEKLISNESPLGQALLDKAVGDSVDVEVPAGLMTYTIDSVE